MNQPGRNLEAASMSSIHVVDYHPAYQPAIDKMMDGIAVEFEEAITGPHSTRLPEVYGLPDRRYWVALAGEAVVGTSGLELLAHGNAVLKRMMTNKEFRGAGGGLAVALLRTVVDWGRSQGVKRIYLGTMAQFKAAQRFYLKHGFQEVAIETLPCDLSVNPIDTLHYRLDLSD